MCVLRWIRGKKSKRKKVQDGKKARDVKNAKGDGWKE